MLTVEEAIQNRISRRNYLTDPIPEATENQLIQSIMEYNAQAGLDIFWIADGTEAFSGLRKSYGMFKGVRSLIGLAGDPVDVHLREKLGYFGEKLVLEGTQLGLGSCWVGGTFDKKSSNLISPQGATPLLVITMGLCPPNKTRRESFIYSLTHRKTKALEELFKADVTPPEWFIRGVKAAQKAPSAINRQPVFFTYKDGEAWAEVKEEEGFQLVDLGIAKLHFALGAQGDFAWGNPGKFTPFSG